MGSGCLEHKFLLWEKCCVPVGVLDRGIGGWDMAVPRSPQLYRRYEIKENPVMRHDSVQRQCKISLYRFCALTPLTHPLWKLLSGPDIGNIWELLSGCNLIRNQRSDDEGLL